MTFGHEGVLYKNSFILYDRETGSLWVHTTGEAVRGPLRGKQLQFLPSVVTAWKKWKTEHPETLVLTGRREDGMMGAFNLNRDRRSYGLSVGQGTRVQLYPFALLQRDRVINDEVEGQKVVVVFDAASGTGAAFERGNLTFVEKNGQMVDQGGRAWNLLQGTSGDQALTPIPATPWLIERWLAFYGPGSNPSYAPRHPGR